MPAAPPMIKVAAPDFVSAVAEVLSAMTEATVSVPVDWFVVKTRSEPAAPAIEPPVMTRLLAATAEPTSTPPEVIVLTPERVSVRALAALKRSVFVVLPPAMVPPTVTVVLLPEAQVSFV